MEYLKPCPHCHAVIDDWHLEWYGTLCPSLYRGTAALDCPVCGEAVSYQQGVLGLPQASVPIIRRSVADAAFWAVTQSAAGNLAGYLNAGGAGQPYANYWSAAEVAQADAAEAAKQQEP